MTKQLKHSLVLCGLLLAASMSFGQTILTMTTLASAVTSTSTTSIQLTSSTGLTAAASAIFVADTGSSGEAMFVNSVSASGGYVGVTRGYQTLGKARTHASGALVFIIPNTPAGLAMNTIAPSGSCTRSSEPFLPVISVGEYGEHTYISDCVGGVWVQGGGIGSLSTTYRVPLPATGAVAYSTPVGTNTTLAATTMYCTEIDDPGSKYVTGLGVMNGATASTDKHLVALYDATGNLIAHSATAGVTASGTNTYQNIPFTTPYYLVGPAVYYACLQTNGTTATLNMLTTGEQDTYTTKGVTGQTFGTIPATITVPTTFTSVVGPYWQLY
jgi:hypothetical protein